MSSLDMEAIRRIRNSKPAGSEGGSKENFYDPPKVGEFKIRFLPPLKGGVPGKLVYKHWNMPGERKMLTCLKTYEKECPICQKLNEYAGRASTDDFLSKASFHENILVLSDPQISPSLPKIANLNGDYNYYWLLDQVLDSDIGDITDPYTGRPVKFKRAVKNKSWERILMAPGPIAPDQASVEKILAMRHDLDKIWRLPDDNYYNMIHEAIKGLTDVLDNMILVARQSASAPAQQSYTQAYTAPAPQPTHNPAPAKAPQPAEDAFPAQATAPATPPPAAAPAARRGVPECFANKAIYYGGFGSYDKAPPPALQTEEQKVQIRKCTTCPHDFDCEKGLQ